MTMMEDVTNEQSKPSSETVKVVVRCRPLNSKEIEEGYSSVVAVDRNKSVVSVDRPVNSICYSGQSEQKCFQFDAAYDSSISQHELYNEAFKPLVDSVLEGFNGTIFAYGQTGTGKTYTMEGLRDVEEFQGVIPQAFKQIFDHIEQNPEKRYLVRASYLEIYQEEVKDLLCNTRAKSKHCALREHGKTGVAIRGLSSYFCSSFAEINDVMTKGNKNRTVGATNMNDHSSRSHAIFSITVEVCETWKDGREHIKMGKLNLVDLAGSERQGKAGTSGERFREATKINMSLSALGNVICSLVDGSSHIPYRNSKLTRLLQDSLGGNSKTVMVATIGPADYNREETINTLRYACRANKIKNKPRINEDPKDAILREYQQEILRLKNLLSIKKKSQESMISASSQDNVTENDNESIIPKCSSEKLEDNGQNLERDLFMEKIRLAEEKRQADLIPLLEPYGLDPSNDPQTIMAELKKRREALVKDDGMVKEEKAKILNQLDETTRCIQNAEEECASLIKRIMWLESKLLNSGKSLLEHTEEQKKQLEQHKNALRNQEEKEKVLREELRAKELTTLELENSLADYRNKVQQKRNKLKKLKKLIRRSQRRQFKIKTEYDVHVTDTDQMLKEITKELKMRKKMVDNFVPPKDQKNIEGQIRYNSDMDKYFLVCDEPLSVKRPQRFTRQNDFRVYSEAGAKLSPMKEMYYSNENVLQLAMEIPEWHKTPFVQEEVDPRIKSMFSSALSDAKESFKLDCKKLKQSMDDPKVRRASLFYAVGQNTLLRQISLPKPKDGPTYEDFAVAENCLGQDLTSECRVKILDDASTSLKGRKPTRGDLYAMPIFAKKHGIFANDGMMPLYEDEDSFGEEEADEAEMLNGEEDIDELIEDLEDIEDMNRMNMNAKKHRRKSRTAASADNFQRNQKVKTPKSSASLSSIQKSECDPMFGECSPRSSSVNTQSCIPDENGEFPEGCHQTPKIKTPMFGGMGELMKDRNKGEAYQDGTKANRRLRPSTATLAFHINRTSKVSQEATKEKRNYSDIRNKLKQNVQENKYLGSPFHCSLSSASQMSREACNQAAADILRSFPKQFNQKRDSKSIAPPMSLEMYQEHRKMAGSNKGRDKRNELLEDPFCSYDSYPPDNCQLNDVDDYLQNYWDKCPTDVYKHLN